MSKFKFQLITAGLLALIYFMTTCGSRQAPAKIEWLTSVDSALRIAAAADKPLMIDFMATWCPPCRAMEESTFSQKAVIERARDFIPVRIDVDKQPDVANKYRSNARKYGGIGIPNLLFLTAQEDTLVHLIGFYPPDSLAQVMDSVKNVYRARSRQ